MRPRVVFLVGAVSSVDIRVIFKRCADDLVGENITLLDHFAYIDVLDRVVVVPERKITACAGKICGFQCGAEGVGIAHIGLGRGRDEQIGGIKPLACIERRQASVFRLKGLDECRVCGVVDVLVPLGCVHHTQCGRSNGLQNALVKAESRTNDGKVDAAVGVLLEE